MNEKDKFWKLLCIVIANTMILTIILGCAQISSVVDQLTSEAFTSVWDYISPHFWILYAVSVCFQILFFYKLNHKS